MCSSYRFIEQQAYEMCEKIRENSLYKFVRIDLAEGSRQDVPVSNSNKMETDLIRKIILEGADGTLFSIEPNVNGLRFAKGEISYQEYQSLQKKETYTVLVYFFLIIGFFSLFMFLGIRYFI